jgi:hypothetical protein
MICAGIFIIFLVSMFSISSYCFAEGDVEKYLAPVDHKYNICGYGNYTDKPYLAFSDLANPFDTSFCTDKCDSCSHSVAKFCVPYMSGSKECTSTKDEITAFTKVWKNMLESNAAGKQIMDLYKSSRAIYICIATAIIFCFAYIYLMSFFAEQIAWTIVGITQISLFVGCGACIFEYLDKKDSTNPIYKESASGFLIGGIVVGLLAIIMLIMLICGFNQLKIAIDVVDASADFIRKTKRVISIPVVYFFFQVIAVLIWLFAVICVWSIGDINASQSKTNVYY